MPRMRERESGYLVAGSILRLGFCRLIALGLDLPDQLQGHDEPSTQAIQFGPKMARYLASITGAQDSKIALPRTTRGSFPNALGEQQRFNTVFDALPLLHQLLALAVRALGILLFRCWHTHHAAGLVITPEIGRKHAQHALRIEPVRFSPSGAAVDENAGGFKNMADDTMCRQQTVQPEAVPSRPKQQTTPIVASSSRAARACRDE